MAHTEILYIPTYIYMYVHIHSDTHSVLSFPIVLVGIKYVSYGAL